MHLSLRGSQILGAVKQQFPDGPFDVEACKYMLESQPREPYGNSLKDLAHVESDMRDRSVYVGIQGVSIWTDESYRRRMLAACLSKDERLVTLTNVALLGSSQMKMDYDTLITDKQRYQDMFSRLPGRAAHLKNSLGHQVQSFLASPDSKGSSIDIDDPVDSWGGCGLQATFSANDLQEACRLHDQLVPLGPLMLALSAATPIYKGKLVVTDTRWEAMCWAGDDRKSSEKPEVPPRLGCTPMYLEETTSARQMNDQSVVAGDGPKFDLHQYGVPAAIATYFAHILEREPLIDTTCTGGPVISSTSQDKRVASLNTQMSTWWPHVRLKLPVLSNVDKGLPWRVEFRPMEAQPSDMENAALVVALRVLQQTIQHFDLDLKIPISAVEKNMNRANTHNAATDQNFRFAVQPYRREHEPAPAFDGWASLDFIFNGDSDDAGRMWRGLLPLARDYLALRRISNLPRKEQAKIFDALDMLSARASGRLETPAQWMRRFVKEKSHGILRDEEISARLYYEMILALSE